MRKINKNVLKCKCCKKEISFRNTIYFKSKNKLIKEKLNKDNVFCSKDCFCDYFKLQTFLEEKELDILEEEDYYLC